VATPGVKIQANDAQELFRQIRDYLECYEQNDDEEFDPEALRKVKGEQ
jgi:20S proteasome alpha/beta subunit